MSSQPQVSRIANGVFDRTHVTQSHVTDVDVLPRVNVSTWPVSERGAIVYNVPDESLYISDGTQWKLVSGGGGGGGGSSLTINNTGASGVPLIDAAAPNVTLKTLVAGNDITLVDNTTSITINADLSSLVPSLTSAGGDVSLVQDGTGPSLSVLGLSAGANTTVTQGADAVTIASSVTLTEAAGGTGSSLVGNAAAPWAVKSIAASGPGVAVTSDASNVYVQNTAALSSAGTSGVVDGTYYASQTLVSSASNPWQLYGITGSTYVSVTSTSTDVTIASSFQVVTVTQALGTIPGNSEVIFTFSGQPVNVQNALFAASVNPMPASLILSNCYCETVGVISINVKNLSSVAYTANDTQTIKILLAVSVLGA